MNLNNRNKLSKPFALAYLLLGLSLIPSLAYSTAALKQFVVTVDAASGELVSQSQLSATQGDVSSTIELKYGVSMIEEFRSPEVWFQTFNASDIKQVEAYLAALEVQPLKVIESSFIHTPESVGGPKAGDVREGHKIYMIGRDIPGAGELPQDMRDKIALGSQGTIEKIGKGIEWDHSYVTSEGTFCVYRADDPSLIEQHAKMMEVPANPITEVQHIVRNFDFAKVTQ